MPRPPSSLSLAQSHAASVVLPAGLMLFAPVAMTQVACRRACAFPASRATPTRLRTALQSAVRGWRLGQRGVAAGELLSSCGGVLGWVWECASVLAGCWGHAPPPGPACKGRCVIRLPHSQNTRRVCVCLCVCFGARVCLVLHACVCVCPCSRVLKPSHHCTRAILCPTLTPPHIRSHCCAP
jgi:hypothetical protein